jgi:hypothetical protein
MLILIIIFQFGVLNFGHWNLFVICNLLFGIYSIDSLNFLTLWTDMGTSLPHHKPLNGCLAARAGPVGAAKNLQLIFVAALPVGDRIKIGFTASQGGPKIFQASFQDPGDGQAQRLDFRV